MRISRGKKSMANIQVFQWLGVTFFAMGIGMLTNRKFIRNIMKDFQGSATNMFYGGLACLAIGLPLVTFYNVWNWDAALIITILGWMSVIKGLMLLMFPAYTMRTYKNVLAKQNKYYIGYVVTALGLILLYLGYLA